MLNSVSSRIYNSGLEGYNISLSWRFCPVIKSLRSKGLYVYDGLTHTTRLPNSLNPLVVRQLKRSATSDA